MTQGSERDRTSHRWRGCDYSAPAGYFVPVCVAEQRCLLGRVVRGETLAHGGILSAREADEGHAAHVELSGLGRVADDCWREIPAHFPAVVIPAHVVMPNHIHGIVQITPTPAWTAKARSAREAGAQHAAPLRGIRGVTPHNVQPGSLGAIVRSFKAAVTKRAREAGLSSERLWQRNFHDRVLRANEWTAALRYIHLNPLRWALDRFNPEHAGDSESEPWLEAQ
ncbi:MAG: hypothetical protein IT463_01690 [Planctomycetes bacterium]|nr:hypothetical protein [Planctomycetota bacterium]